MIKKLIVFFVLLIGLAFFVSAAPILNVPNQNLIQGFARTINLADYTTNTSPVNFSVTPENPSQVNCTVSGVNKEILTMTPIANFNSTSHCTIFADDLTTVVNQTISIVVAPQNPDFEDIPTMLIQNAEKNESQTTTFVLRNRGNINLTNINVTFSGDSKYNVTFTPNTIANLAVGDFKDVSIKLFVPMNEPVGTHSIGTVRINSDQKTESFDLQLNVLSKLEISNLDVQVASDTDTDVKNGEKIKYDARPEDAVVFGLELRNRFTHDEDIAINDITVTITIKNIDQGDDIELESDPIDIDANDEQTLNLKFKVPLKVNEDTYDVDIHVEGEDDNRVTHIVDWTLTLKVEKQTHNVKIMTSELSPTSIECGRTASLSVELMNLGAETEDAVELEVTNTELGINARERDISLDQDYESDQNTYQKTFTFTIPQDAPTGSHRISIRSYYYENVLSDIKYVDLVVNRCEPTTPLVQETTQNETTETGQIEEKQPVTTPIPEQQPETPETGITIEQPPTPVYTAPQSFRETGAYMALLILAMITITVAILMIVAKVILKKNE